MSPGSLAFDSQGEIYVASNSSRQLHRFNGVTGAFIDVFLQGSVGHSLFTPAVPEPSATLLAVIGILRANGPTRGSRWTAQGDGNRFLVSADGL